MAVPYQPQNVTAQQTDGKILISWSGALNATSYTVQRSTDNANFTSISTGIVSSEYIDTPPLTAVVYYYRVFAVNGSGNSPYSNVVFMVAAPPGEMSLGELRLRAQQTADRVNSNFVTQAEWNAFLRLAMYELYDLLIGTYEDYNIGSPAYINTNATLNQFELPSGTNYKGGVYGGTSGDPLPRLYKLSGVDLGVNTSNNAWVTLHSFNWVERNNYVYPNSTSTIYGVYNMRYRVIGTTLYIIPKPAGNQQIRLWYAPVLPALLADSDCTTIGYSGWLRYPIVRAAKYALDKEEGSDTSKLDAEMIYLKQRIEELAANRDQGMPNTISNTRRDPIYGGGFSNDGGANGGW